MMVVSVPHVIMVVLIPMVMMRMGIVNPFFHLFLVVCMVDMAFVLFMVLMAVRVFAVVRAVCRMNVCIVLVAFVIMVMRVFHRSSPYSFTLVISTSLYVSLF